VTEIAERRAAITGLGLSEIGRRLPQTSMELTMQACLAAIADAGLTRDDIDGLASYPGGEPPAWDIQDALRLKLRWYDGGIEGPGQTRAMMNAIMAVASGQARHVLVYRTVRMYRGEPSWGNKPLDGMMQWLMPFHTYSASNFTALYSSRFMHERGITREQLAWIAITQRKHAGLNPIAIFREPLTHDEYMAAEVLTTPMCLYDFDVPVDGSTVFVISSVDAAKDSPHPLVRVEAMSALVGERMTWCGLERGAMWTAAPDLWNRTDLRPSDVDVAGLYDGFSTLTLEWIEALGLCPPGEAGNFIEGGANIELGGLIPINTEGGQLSGGRLHGFRYLHEVVSQLRHQCDERQVRDAEVGLISCGGGPLAFCLLVVRED
jgi:acetyl-CoA acetyltransferase